MTESNSSDIQEAKRHASQSSGPEADQVITVIIEPDDVTSTFVKQMTRRYKKSVRNDIRILKLSGLEVD